MSNLLAFMLNVSAKRLDMQVYKLKIKEVAVIESRSAYMV